MTLALIFLFIGLAAGIYLGSKRGIPFTVIRPTPWAIGIMQGSSLAALASPQNLKNPVLTASDVTDCKAEFVADPFLLIENEKKYMFFEVLDLEENKGVIALASSGDGLKWRYERVVLRESFHLSYPFVFKWQNDYYMVPETFQTHAVRLYKARSFPYEWEFVKNLLDGQDFVDATLFQHQEKWWMFVSTTANNILYLYHAESPLGPWLSHASNPLVSNNLRHARPGGKVAAIDGKLIRFAQDDFPEYGTAVHAFEILELSPTIYREQKLAGKPLLRPTGGLRWNAAGMHHIAIEQQASNMLIAAVDGRGRERSIGIQHWRGQRPKFN